MRYASTLVAVKNMDISKRFYRDVSGLQVTADFGANVTLEGGVILQTMDTRQSFTRTGQVFCLLSSESFTLRRRTWTPFAAGSSPLIYSMSVSCL